MTQQDPSGRSPAAIRVTRTPSAEEAAAAAATEVATRARDAVARRARFTVAVSGGRSPWVMLGMLDPLGMPWAATHIFQVDERIAPEGDPTRNLTGLRASLPPGCEAQIHPMPVGAADLDAASAAYAGELPAVLDLVHLGLGADGHTASLVPDDPVLSVTDADVAVTGPYQGQRRMTLTYPRIARTRAVLWLVTGAEKGPALTQLLAGDPAIPAGRIGGPDQVLFTDIR